MPGVARQNSTNSNATGTNVTGLNYVAGGYTVAFWIRNIGTGGGDIIRQSSTASLVRHGYLIGFSATHLTARHFTATTTTTYSVIAGSTHRNIRWAHYALTYDESVLRGYINGTLQGVLSAPNVPTANAACTTTLGPNVNGLLSGDLFDLQIILGGAVPAQNILKLMDPTVINPNLKGRYFGREFVTLGAGDTLRDESGNGNNLTTPATTGRLDIGEEPPIRPTFA